MKGLSLVKNLCEIFFFFFFWLNLSCAMALLGRPPWDKCPPHSRLAAWPGQYSLREWGQELRSFLLVMFCHVFLYAVPGAFILRSLYLTSWAKSLQMPLQGLLMRRGRLEDNFPHSDSVPTSALLLVLLSHLPHDPKVMKPPEACSHGGWPPPLCCSTWPWTKVTFMGENGTVFPWVLNIYS